MDKTIRANKHCIVGLPRCDFAFSSTRSCFIAYGFHESALEMNLLRDMLRRRGIEVVEAGGTLAPGQSAFCAKICSKIITSQFCVVLLNNDIVDDREQPNANVNMEYGLMLGFNKYVVPFQREGQSLPFNVAGLDTIKYTNANFTQRAKDAIDVAIKATRQDAPVAAENDQSTATYWMLRKFVFTRLDTPGDEALFHLGSPLGFNLLNDFTGLRYAYLGQFAALRPENVLWRIRMLAEILGQRYESLPDRIAAGIASQEGRSVIEEMFRKLQVFAVVTSDADKLAVTGELATSPPAISIEIVTIGEIQAALRGHPASPT